MTLIQLETFLKIVETGNFTLAANELGYAQSTVTTQIKQLEEELGTLLFERLGKTIVLTSAGERLAGYAEHLLQLQREIYLEVPESDEPVGALKLGVSESLCYNRFPMILTAYKKRFPKVDIRIQFVMHESFPELLKKGELDMVYTVNPLIEDENLTMLYKREETLGFYVCPEHRLARKRKVKEEDLDGEPMLLTSHNCSFRKLFLEDMAGAGVTPHIILETASKEILKQFAVRGLGIAFMPDMTAEEEMKDERLVRLKWAGGDWPVYSQVFIHKDKRMNVALEGLLEQIVSY